MFELCTPWTNSAPEDRSDKQTKNIQTHHIFAPTAGARSTISPKLCMVIEDAETIEKVAIIFDPTQFFLQGARNMSG